MSDTFKKIEEELTKDAKESEFAREMERRPEPDIKPESYEDSLLGDMKKKD